MSELEARLLQAEVCNQVVEEAAEAVHKRHNLAVCDKQKLNSSPKYEIDDEEVRI